MYVQIQFILDEKESPNLEQIYNQMSLLNAQNTNGEEDKDLSMIVQFIGKTITTKFPESDWQIQLRCALMINLKHKC